MNELTVSMYQGESDVLELRAFALESYSRYANLQNWEPRRLEGFVYHRDDAGLVRVQRQLASDLCIWRREGRVVGWVIPEYPGGVYLQVNRDDVETLSAQIDWATEHLTITDASGTRLEIYCHDDDDDRQAELERRGFRPTDVVQVQRSRTLAPGNLMQTRSAPEGFVVRSVVDPEFESPRMARLFNRAFNRDFHQPAEYANYARYAPSYRVEFEVVVDAPDGSLASHVGLTAHDEESFLIVEPVCTDPDFKNLGLARAAMYFGLELAAQRGIRRAFIGADGSNPVSNHAYESMGFGDPRYERQWRRDF